MLALKLWDRASLGKVQERCKKREHFREEIWSPGDVITVKLSGQLLHFKGRTVKGRAWWLDLDSN